ncbi:MAG: alkaline phosphatase PhoX [Halioglobus sp.]
MPLSRRTFLKGSALSTGAIGLLGSAVAAANSGRFGEQLAGPACGTGNYGPLVKDPEGILDLPHGFSYKVLSRERAVMSDGNRVPALHDGMGAFHAGKDRVALVRNHEMAPWQVEGGLVGAAHVEGSVYDFEAEAGGTTNLLVGPDRWLMKHYVSLAGTVNNCAGGVTPWNTWLTCEEDYTILGKPHGYVFEVDPLGMGDPRPIRGMGRYEHEAVCFDRKGNAYLTEDDDGPHGCFYRFIPNKPLDGPGSLHGGGKLAALGVPGLDTDLSIVQTPGMVLKAAWIDVPNPDPGRWGTPVREQVIDRGATPIQKCEGCWTDLDGSIWFVSSRGDGKNQRREDRSVAAHSGQIWRYDPVAETIELIVLFPVGTIYDRPDNIVASPYGFAVACTDGIDDQWLLGITQDGKVFPLGMNALNKRELAGATFSPDGKTLFANFQGPPGLTVAIEGPWQG